MRQASKPLARVAAIRQIAQRFSFLIFLLAALSILITGRMEGEVLDGARVRVLDAVAPVMDAIARPVDTVTDFVEEGRAMLALREENVRLRRELEELRHFRQIAFTLAAEVETLQGLTNYTPPPPASHVAGRVIADNSGTFVRSVAVNVGSGDGVREGQAAMGSRGLVGRVVRSGPASAQVLLITDLNARIPIVLEESRYRAILAGDNTGLPRLAHLPAEVRLSVGERVVTSGHGGMFPPGLPVGIVKEIGEHGIRVRPFEDLTRLEAVRIVDFRPWREDALVASQPSP